MYRNPSTSLDRSSLMKLCQLINDTWQEIGIPLERPWRIEDFDSMTSKNLQKLIAFLIKGSTKKTIQVDSVKPVKKFQEWGITVNHKAGLFELYHQVKKMFPENSDLFHMSVLLMPARHPKKTKDVLVYIYNFYQFAKEVEQPMREWCNEAISEIKEKRKAVNELKVLEDKIASALKAKEARKLDEVNVHKHMKKAREEALRLENALTVAKGACKEAEDRRKEKELEVSLLKQHLETLKNDVSKANDKIVKNPELLPWELEKRKKLYLMEVAKRDEYLCKIEKVKKDITENSQIYADTKKTLEKLFQLNKTLEDLKEQQSLLEFEKFKLGESSPETRVKQKKS